LIFLNLNLLVVTGRAGRNVIAVETVFAEEGAVERIR